MQFNTTENMISFIRDDITPQEVDAFIGRPFNPMMHPQYEVIKKYIKIIDIYHKEFLRDSYLFFDELGILTTMDYPLYGDEVIEAEPIPAIYAVFDFLHREWNRESLDEQKL